MAAAVALGVYLPLLVAASAAVVRRPVLALYAFVVGLALHNVVMALLWGAGVRGAPLSAIGAWKETLLAVALGTVAWRAVRAGRPPFRPGAVDALALAFAAVAVVYALLPQSLLGGDAGAEAVAYGLRHAVVPVAAFVLGRALALGPAQLRRLGWTVLGTAAAVAAFGLADLFLVPIEWWRGSGAVGWYRDQLGFDYHGPGGLPENVAFNADEGVFRRLISTFVSPLATAFLLAVALLLAGSGLLGRLRLVVPVAALLSAALLYTLSRSTFLALAAGLVVLAFARRRAWPVGAAVAVLGTGIAFAAAFPSVAPETRFFPEDLPFQEQQARERGDLPGGGALDPDDPSLRSHLDSLRAGVEIVLSHPQGYGLGNAGAVASRFGAEPVAGESTYTELGVETGVAGLALFLAWSLGLLLALLGAARRGDRAAAWLAAALATVGVLGVQTDVIGVPWLAYALWALAGARLPEPAPVETRDAATLRARTATGRPVRLLLGPPSWVSSRRSRFPTKE